VKLLIVEDDPNSMSLLRKLVEQMGFEIFAARNGAEALTILHREDIRLVVTDWMMPVMDGATLCRIIRGMKTPGYVYIIFLTGRTNKADLIDGMKAGADDYLAKPCNAEELQVRINAGIRVLKLEHSLVEKNEVIRKDLEAAKELQRSFLPKSLPVLSNLEFAERFIPSTYVSGDIYSVFRLDETNFGFYHIDVMGHGVLSALFSLSVHQRLLRDLYPYGLLKAPIDAEPCCRINSPIEVARILNTEKLLERFGSYFTMVYGTLNIGSGRMELYRAGHNPPLILRADGSSSCVAEGGPPIGLGIPMDDNDAVLIQLAPGDAFVVFSDGVNECRSHGDSGAVYGFERAREVLEKSLRLGLEAGLDRLIADLDRFHGGSEFEDDVSVMALRWKGSLPPGAHKDGPLG